ncbi:phosphatase inhibitor 2 [Cryptosporidium xiaoi]|uniref:Phosphatase inhibitor 2 n=1 Tax=Cryptosporidium xiaoi TaxID=659607 RepID=A0AAV9XVM1_9CRYT
MKKEGIKDSYKTRKGVTWDEDNIELHDADRGSRMKIDEPNTPYYYYSSGNSSFSEDESQEPMINAGKVVTPEDIRLKLVEYSRNLDKDLNEGICMSDNCHFTCNSPKGTGKNETFESKRKLHYNEFIIAKSSGELFSDEERASDSDKDSQK